MYVIVLTLLFKVTIHVCGLNFNETSLNRNDSFYDIYEWVAKLNLQRCSFIEIGLNYFALFVEDDTKHYFIGICDFATLTDWRLCSSDLFDQRKSKCCLKLRRRQYNVRVHRRFCDIKLMMDNKDCICSRNIFSEEVLKVTGFPTCYVAPTPETLCRYYNACGLSQCKTTAIEGKVYAVECNPFCKGRQPFCEFPVGARTSSLPKVTSFWSKWRRVAHPASHIIHSLATCINKYTRRGAVDCLGPGTGCCPEDVRNCSCETFIDDGVLYVERKIYNRNLAFKDNLDFVEEFLEQTLDTKKKNRKIRDTEEYEDDDDNEDIDDDIEIEETEEALSPTTEELEKEELIEEIENELVNTTNLELNDDNISIASNKSKVNGKEKTFPNNLILLCTTIFVVNILL